MVGAIMVLIVLLPTSLVMSNPAVKVVVLAGANQAVIPVFGAVAKVTVALGNTEAVVKVGWIAAAITVKVPAEAVDAPTSLSTKYSL